jgi:phosphate transport system permease protein
MGIYTRRRFANSLVIGLSVAATAFGLVWLALVLWTLLYEGFPAAPAVC